MMNKKSKLKIIALVSTSSFFFIYLIQINYIDLNFDHEAELLSEKLKSSLKEKSEFEEEQVAFAFVTFATKSHFDLLKVLVESVHYFSNQSIIAYGVDIQIPFEYPRLIRKLINRSDCGNSIYYCKPYVISISDVKYGVYLDVDSVVNQNIDLLFNVSKSWKGNHTLSPIHINDPNNYLELMDRFNLSYKSMPYVHGHVIWNVFCLDFVKKWHDLSKQIESANYDETALNILLWTVNATHFTALYDPYFGLHDDYLLGKLTQKQIPILYLLFHGCKKAEYSFLILKKLIRNSNKIIMQNKEMESFCRLEIKAKESIYDPVICKYIK